VGLTTISSQKKKEDRDERVRGAARGGRNIFKLEEDPRLLGGMEQDLGKNHRIGEQLLKGSGKE